MDSTVVDSVAVVTQAVVDSATWNGWLAPVIAKFSFIPPWLQLVLVGIASSVLVDLLELVMVRVKAIKGVGPIISWLLERWAKNPRFISPLILFGVTATATGGAGIGAVVAAIAAGIRSMTTRENKMLNAQDKTKLTKLSHAAGLLALLFLLPSTAHAVDLKRAVSNAWIQSQVNVGLENRWVAKPNASFHDARPVPAAFGRWEVSLPFLRLAAHLEAARRVDRDLPWEARAGFSVRVK